MSRTRSLLVIFGLIVIASLWSACSAEAEPTAPTATPTSTPEQISPTAVPTSTPERPTPTDVPTSVPELPTATSVQTESQRPTKTSEVPRISAEELKERLDSGKAIVVVDSRSKYEYDKKHITGAISAPENYDEYPLDQEIVLYCT